MGMTKRVESGISIINVSVFHNARQHLLNVYFTKVRFLCLYQQLLAGFTGRFVSWCHCKLCTMFKMFYTAPSGVLLLIAYSDSFHLLLLLPVRLSAQPFI